ncbi:hypothetical protein CEXT_430211 [Caerostris extrusa]|uniref:Uncharacterized protein n=1 Tax=Caerostris extrusa TaxID=172846 RepID=A0AAV4XY31_CAEEX|nr:hypothetical protein CEXT_430211 [Caerostris extrusa]
MGEMADSSTQKHTGMIPRRGGGGGGEGCCCSKGVASRIISLADNRLLSAGRKRCTHLSSASFPTKPQLTPSPPHPPANEGSANELETVALIRAPPSLPGVSNVWVALMSPPNKWWSGSPPPKAFIFFKNMIQLV